MPRKIVLLLVSLLIVGLLLPMAFGGGGKLGPEEKQAVRAAHSWLAHVDDGRYDRSWKDAASLFQRQVPEKVWVDQIRGVRAPLGKVKVRKLLGAQHMTSLPGAPDGDYVVIQFETSFEGKASSVETITPMKDGKRGYRVSGYYIK